MAISAKHNETTFGVGDVIRITQEIVEGEKTRLQAFEGMIIKIKGRDIGKTMTVRRIGAAQVGIEKIYPLALPSIKEIQVVQKGKRGIKRSKLYYTRTKSKKEINKIFSRSTNRELSKEKKVSTKPATKSTTKSKKTTKSTKKSANASKKK